MNYQQGLEDGKKSQSKGWIISGLIGLIGIILIYLYNIPKDFKYSKEYTEGYVKGVKLRRLKYWTFGLLSILVISLISQSFQKKQESKIDSIVGTYYIEGYNGSEYITELKENGKWVYKSFKNGQLEYSETGLWETENIELDLVKETRRVKILIFNNSYYLEVTKSNCLRGSSKKNQDVVYSKKPNLSPSNPDFLRSLNLFSPIPLETYQSLCKTDKIKFTSERNQSQNFKNNSQKKLIITSKIEENKEINGEELFYNQTLLNKNSKNKNFHESVKVYKNNVYSVQTKKFIIRVDELENGELRYSSWGGDKNISSEPSLILYNGERIFEGSGGNNYTEFNNGNLKYIVWENRISETGIPYRLEVLQNDKLILEQTGDVF